MFATPDVLDVRRFRPFNVFSRNFLREQYTYSNTAQYRKPQAHIVRNDRHVTALHRLTVTTSKSRDQTTAFRVDTCAVSKTKNHNFDGQEL